MKKQIFTSGVTGILILLALFHLFLFYSCNGFAADEVPGQQPEETVVAAEKSVPKGEELKNNTERET